MSAVLTDNEVVPAGVRLEGSGGGPSPMPSAPETGMGAGQGARSDTAPRRDSQTTYLEPDQDPASPPEEGQPSSANGTLPLPRLPAHELAVGRQFSYQPLRDSVFSRTPWYASVRFRMGRGMSGSRAGGGSWGRRSLGRHWFLLLAVAILLLVVLAVGIPLAWIFTNRQQTFPESTASYPETTPFS